MGGNQQRNHWPKATQAGQQNGNTCGTRGTCGAGARRGRSCASRGTHPRSPRRSPAAPRLGAPAARWAPPVRPPPVPAPAEASPAAGPADRPLAPAASRSPDEAALLRMNIQWFKYSWRCWAAPAQWKKSSPGPAPPERTAPAAPGPAAAAFTPEPGPRIEGLQLLCLHKNPSRCTPNR